MSDEKTINDCMTGSCQGCAHMPNEKLGSEPMFPTKGQIINNGTDKGGIELYGSITYRQWLIGMAMQGIASDPSRTASNEQYAKEAVELADAVLKRERETR
jgi:hypothetical protein